MTTKNKLNNDIAPAIQLVDPKNIKIIHSVKFKFCCPELCNISRNRKYFHVLENSYEYNSPAALPCIPCMPPNICCGGNDSVTKTFFDRGVFDQEDFFHQSGFVSGPVKLMSGTRTYQCLYIDCNPCCNEFCDCCMCFDHGEKVRIVPFENICWCCSNEANYCDNMCGICGLKTGEPRITCNFINNLDDGQSKLLQDAFSKARIQWSKRTGIS
jgi:hypothetical protein